jgi:hypothetical protein
MTRAISRNSAAYRATREVRASSRSAISSFREELSRSGERAKRETCSEQGESLSLLSPANRVCRMFQCPVESQRLIHIGRPGVQAPCRSAISLIRVGLLISRERMEWENLVKRKTCLEDR